MQRLVLALLFLAVIAGLIALLARGVAAALGPKGGGPAFPTEDMMQKIAYFLLLCLIVYVSFSGAS